MPSLSWRTSRLTCSMRRAIPNPCSGPSACSVFKIIKSSVPCSTSDLFVSMAPDFPSRYRPHPRSFGLSTGGYHLSFGMSIGIRRLQCLDLASKVSPELSANRRFNASRAATFAA